VRLSRGFACAVFGIAMTIFSWFSPWAWPAWPALTTMHLLVGTQTSFADLSFGVRGAFVILLIVINVAAWAGAAMLLWSVARQWRTVWRRPPPAV
jgi:hypothetical protein